jgi:prepilin-type N-terminal cleavage/methylation domain-containing protein
MNKRGFSLIELIVVIGIISIILTVSTLNFHNWTVKSNVEKETREMYADFNRLRTRAIYTNKRLRITLIPKNYTFHSYSASELLTAGTIVGSKSLPYEITLANGASVSGTTIDFDTHGFTDTNLLTIRVAAPSNNAALDCLVISNGQTNLGKMENGNCVQK